MQQLGPYISSYGIENHGIQNVDVAHWNYSAAALYEEALRRHEGNASPGGALVCHTGLNTGRAPNDKFIVEEPTSKNDIAWGGINRPIDQAKFDAVHKRFMAYLQGRDVFIQDCFAGADPEHRLPVRVITETAWHNLFAHNMFIQPKPDELADFEPGFTIIQSPSFHSDPETDGTNSEVFILVDHERCMVMIGGTGYAGEIKKSVFSIMNFLLPAKGILPMHASANVGPNGDSALFFGLSGTGKTTLSADSSRTLIGDDEHGWTDNGLFNFEGGCYAKVINLSPKAEPEIHATTRMFGTVLENVIMNMDDRSLDLDDASLTENTRASYPLSYIPNTSETGLTGHPKNIIMLTCDAFGVLPPVSRLAPDQAMYHFLSGYTAKVAGTEKGVKEPSATFSTCVGAPFILRHPTVYADLLGKKVAEHGTDCWLVNTGWSGGGFGGGERMKIAHTRTMVNAALDGQLVGVATRADPNFGMLVPDSCPGVPADVLDPRNTWKDKYAYDAAARHLRSLFEENFVKFEKNVDDKVKAAAIRAAA